MSSIMAKMVLCFGWVGRWVGGWVVEFVGLLLGSCVCLCVNWVCGWVGGWVGRFFYLRGWWIETITVCPTPSSHSFFIEDITDWVGGWVEKVPAGLVDRDDDSVPHPFLTQLLHARHHRLGLKGVQARGGLVRKHDLARVTHQFTGEREAFAFSSTDPPLLLVAHESVSHLGQSHSKYHLLDISPFLCVCHSLAEAQAGCEEQGFPVGGWVNKGGEKGQAAHKQQHLSRWVGGWVVGWVGWMGPT